jgi:dihydropteroate synthase
MMAKDTFLNRKITLNLKGELIDLSKTAVMGILNLTPDSFYDRSRVSSVDSALKRIETYLQEGASFIDIGAYSSRPGADEVNTDEELKRILPVVAAISKRFPEAKLSVDTFRARVAKESIEAGAHLINDISAGNMDEAMFETVAALKVPYIVMHMQGTPQTMQQNPVYTDIAMEVTGYFADKVYALKKLGLTDLILDPGFGFAKNQDHNYILLNKMEHLNIFGLPLLVGFSRKSMIYKFLGITPEEALNGTTVLNTLALQKGAAILRVHDVKAAMECITLVEKMRQQ